MFITYSLPFLDSRTFLKEDSHRLNEALWNYPEYESTFFRSIGEIKERRKLNPAIPYLDRQYAEAVNAVRIDANYSSGSFPFFMPYIQFRRMYYDNFIGRFDIGIRNQCKNKLELEVDPAGSDCRLRRKWQCSGQDIYNLIEWLFTMPAGVKKNIVLQEDKSKKVTEWTNLYDIGQPLAQLFAYATTERPGENFDEKTVEKVTALKPQMILECKEEELKAQSVKSLEKDKRFCRIDSDKLESWKVRLYLLKVRKSPVWVIVKPEGKSHYDDIKNLRVYLTKLQQNRSALKCLFRQLKQRRSSLDEEILNAKKIEQFMDESLKLIGRQKVSGYNVEQITGLLNQIDRIINGDELEFLLSEYEDIREIYHFKGRLEHMANRPEYHINAGQVNIVERAEGTATFIGKQYNGAAGEELRSIIEEIMKYKHLAPSENQEEIETALAEAEDTLQADTPDKKLLERCIGKIKLLAGLVNGIPELAESFQKLLRLLPQLPGIK